MATIAISILVLGITGLIAAVVLYYVAKRFHVYEDPRIEQIEQLLPGANCGACGRSGCHDFACACATADSLENLNCPGAGPENMRKIAAIVGLAPSEAVAMTAIVKCNGSCSRRPHINIYDGVNSCAIENAFYAGETPCQYGCLGCGDCEQACPYDAIHIDSATLLPEVEFDKCVGCGKCVSACPRGICALVPKRRDPAMVWVACVNHDKGALALKECEAACIGCGICRKVCPTQAPVITSFVAEIEPSLCTGCGKCIEKCPRKSILSAGELHPEQPLTDKTTAD